MPRRSKCTIARRCEYRQPVQGTSQVYWVTCLNHRCSVPIPNQLTRFHKCPEPIWICVSIFFCRMFLERGGELTQAILENEIRYCILINQPINWKQLPKRTELINQSINRMISQLVDQPINQTIDRLSIALNHFALQWEKKYFLSIFLANEWSFPSLIFSSSYPRYGETEFLPAATHSPFRTVAYFSRLLSPAFTIRSHSSSQPIPFSYAATWPCSREIFRQDRSPIFEFRNRCSWTNGRKRLFEVVQRYHWHSDRPPIAIMSF